MKCYKCDKDTTKTDGSSRGKPIYDCECGNRFTSEQPRFLNKIDKFLLAQTYGRCVRNVAEAFGCSVATVHKWANAYPKPQEPSPDEIKTHLKKRFNGKQIADYFRIELDN